MKTVHLCIYAYAIAVISLATPTHEAYADVREVSRQIVHFDLPEQPLQTSLIEFALQAKVTILADNHLLKGVRSQSIVGPLTTNNALENLLVNSSLSFQVQQDTGVYVIHEKITENNDSTLNANDEEHKNLQEIDEVLVTGLRYPFRYNNVTNTKSQNGVNYFDSSRFLNVLPQNLIQDQKPTDLNDLLKYASSITPGDGISDSNDDMYIRGFERNAIYIDGFRLGSSTGIKLMPANSESVEILKGPSTLLYGQAEPGGIVNVIRKKPQDDSFVHAEVGAGDLGRQYLSIDINSQVPKISDVNFRLIMASDSQDVAGEISNIQKELMAPSLSWKLSDNTTFDANYEFHFESLERDRNYEVLKPFGNNFKGATLAQIAQQARPEFSTEFNLYNLELNHYFTADWRLRAKYFWLQENRIGIRTTSESLLQTGVLLKREELGRDYFAFNFAGQVMIPGIINAQDPFYRIGIVRSLYDEEGDETANNASVNLDGSFETVGLEHRLNLGADWHRQDIYKNYIVELRNLYPNTVFDGLAFEEDLGGILTDIVDSTKTRGKLESQELRLLYDDYGIYVQDNLEFNEHWIASAGTRYTLTKGRHFDITDRYFTDLPTHKKLSSQLGVVFKPTETHSLFTNYSEALRVNYSIDDIGSKITEPELSDQIEVGIKSLEFNGKFLSSLAFFSIDKNNIVDITLLEGYRTALTAHQQRVRGVDYDFTLQVSPSLNVMGAISRLDPIIRSGVNKGKKPALVADKTASLFVHYDVTKNLELSGGIKYVSKRTGERTELPVVIPITITTEAEAFNLDAYKTLDLGLAYTFELLSAQSKFQITAKNVLDEKYYTARLIGVRENLSEGRSVIGTLKVDF
jgi:iron complex outermembrane recepter protein